MSNFVTSKSMLQINDGSLETYLRDVEYYATFKLVGKCFSKMVPLLLSGYNSEGT